MTALMWASCQGQAACVQLLLPVSDPLTKLCNGMTSLMYSAMNGYGDCARLLLPVSDIQARDRYGKTASCWAKDDGHIQLADFIEAYTLARRVMLALSTCTASGPSRKSRCV